jgi:hypothetical protein
MLAILLIGAIMCRGKITVQSGAERHPQDAERREDGGLRVVRAGRA